MNIPYHVPALCEEVFSFLITSQNGIYVDGTLGGGGHAEYLLTRLDKESLYVAIDQDSDAINYAKNRLSKFTNISYHYCNFFELDKVLDKLKLKKVNGLLLDLGVSSFQIDNHNRGFSYMQDAELDMRMDKEATVTAADILNSTDETKLIDIIRNYGEERQARRIAKQIIIEREKKPLYRTSQLKEIIQKVVPTRFEIKTYARVFQALRIMVNCELDNLQAVLDNGIKYLAEGGRLVVISYHSLEDRIVKRFLKTKEHPCTCPPEFPQCMCNKIPEIKILTRKVIKPKTAEIESNPRVRSARLRAGVKI